MGNGGQDRVSAAAEELYAGDPEQFTGRRAELVAAARTDGDRDAAQAIGALRKPTRAAWVVNVLARADPGAPPKLVELAGALRAAQQARQGPRLRELSAARGPLVDALTAQALAAAGLPDPPPQLRLEVTQTLTAALADPGTAADFAAGRLTRAVQWSGFGVLPADAGADDGAGEVTGAGRRRPGKGAGASPGSEAADEQPETAPRSTAAPQARAEPRAKATPRAKAEPKAKAEPQAKAEPRAKTEPKAKAEPRAKATPRAKAEPRAAARAVERRPEGGPRQADERQRQRQEEAAKLLARQQAELAAGRRERIEEAERAVTDAAAAATEAGATEDGLESEVRDLEGRLDRARSELAAARRRARQAEASERRARQALDRLPPG